jgi:hypothetical protein
MPIFHRPYDFELHRRTLEEQRGKVFGTHRDIRYYPTYEITSIGICGDRFGFILPRPLYSVCSDPIRCAAPRSRHLLNFLVHDHAARAPPDQITADCTISI